MTKTNKLRFGFFFTASSGLASALYFAGFQRGLSSSHADQIIIAEVGESDFPGRKVAYILDSVETETADERLLERLCRIAVSQFLCKRAADNFFTCSLPLELTAVPWDGEVLAI